MPEMEAGHAAWAVLLQPSLWTLVKPFYLDMRENESREGSCPEVWDAAGGLEDHNQT